MPKNNKNSEILYKKFQILKQRSEYVFLPLFKKIYKKGYTSSTVYRGEGFEGKNHFLTLVVVLGFRTSTRNLLLRIWWEFYLGTN